MLCRFNGLKHSECLAQGLVNKRAYREILGCEKQSMSRGKKKQRHRILKRPVAVLDSEGSCLPLTCSLWVKQERGLVPGLLLANRSAGMVSELVQKDHTAFQALASLRFALLTHLPRTRSSACSALGGREPAFGIIARC